MWQSARVVIGCMRSRPLKRPANRIRATLDQSKSPVTKDQGSVPIADAIRAYWERDMLSFGIPAHSRPRSPTRSHQMGRCRRCPHGLTDESRLGHPRSSVEDPGDAEELFAEAAEAQQTPFSTGGSSMNVRVAITTVASPGETLVMARNGHKSSFAGLVLSGAQPVYLDQVYDDELEIAPGPLPNDLAQLLDAHPQARAALVFTPSYYGTSADVRGLADVCHERELPLVTDDAWGLDYKLSGHPALPEGALTQGSDLAIGSVHKTLTGLGQTSVLSVGSDRIDTERLGLCFELQESTSTSTPAALEHRRRAGTVRPRRHRTARPRLAQRRATACPACRRGARAASDRPRSIRGVTAVDPTHVIIEAASVGLTGFEADDWLRDERMVDVELVDHRRIMPLVTFAHGKPEIDRLVRALRDLVSEKGSPGKDTDVRPLPTRSHLRTEQATLPRDGLLRAVRERQTAPGDRTRKRRARHPYPPGIPAIAPGELYNQEAIDYLEEIVAAGAFVEGAADQTLSTLSVVARGARHRLGATRRSH